MSDAVAPMKRTFIDYRIYDSGRAVSFGCALFILCIFGILSRPGSDVASFWPSNAFMLGMLVRFPILATPASWLACGVAYAAADFTTGATVTKTIVLNFSNLVSVTVGYVILSQLSRADQKLSRPTSVLLMLVAIGIASLSTGVIGVMADPILFGGKPKGAFFFWSISELVNYIAFLPMILTFPDEPLVKLKAAWRQVSLVKLLPLLSLAATAMASAAIGGPGAVAFPILALLWCALTYNLFVTSCLCVVFAAWTLLAISTGYIPIAGDFTDRTTQTSIRLAVMLMGLAPLAVASVMAAREEVVRRLLFLSTHDQMTGLLNRTAFLSAAQSALESNHVSRRSVAILMLDIDRFKSINDRYGHAAGDEVIRAFAQVLKSNLRDTDIFGRLGGEEFAVLLRDCATSEAQIIGARVNRAFEMMRLQLASGEVISATVSIGMTVTETRSSIDALLAQADLALYRAKDRGRNRLEISQPATVSTGPIASHL